MLSVIIPAYQAEVLLPRLLVSLDSAPGWEAVIVDDGSTDGTAQVAEEWLSSRTTGQLIRLNHGTPGYARQVGLEAARGDFVTFADADDQVVTSVLDHAPARLDWASADVFISGYRETLRDAEFNGLRCGHGPVWRAPSRRVLTSRAAVWGKVYRRSFLEDRLITFPPLRSADDVLFSWRLAAARPKVLETKDIGYVYWVDPHGQLTRDPSYFRDGLDSLARLCVEARRSDGHGFTLGEYAFWKGALHIIRKSNPSERPALGRLAMARFINPRSGESR